MKEADDVGLLYIFLDSTDLTIFIARKMSDTGTQNMAC